MPGCMHLIVGGIVIKCSPAAFPNLSLYCVLKVNYTEAGQIEDAYGTTDLMVFIFFFLFIFYMNNASLH